MAARGALMAGNVVGNVYDKYGTKNPIARALMAGFLRAVGSLYARVAPASVLEVGCGEGRLAQYLVTHAPRPSRFVATDLETSAVDPGLDPLIEVRQASVYELPFETGTFDLVVCCEVLEHLDDPDAGLAEVARVARRAVIVSTPREPLWRALNVLRGKYLGDLGNTPGHVQHFGRRDLERLARRRLRLLDRCTPLPWTVLLGEPLPVAPRAAGAQHDPEHEREAQEGE
jgi:2-polyprenyl-3-methyl-5-hydroxy-6-metoxy-1,4-benzoquinol methylase